MYSLMTTPITEHIWQSPGWHDYELLDFGYGNRLERFGDQILIRPDARALSKPLLPELTWHQAAAKFVGQGETKGEWQIKKLVPEKWQMEWDGIRFLVKLTPFKHTGVFPEQAVEWQLLHDQITSVVASGRTVRMLNVFAYTGIATLVAARAGAEVTTVDASKPAMNWFRENQTVAGLLDKPIRMILEDAVKFMSREQKRGRTYDIIMMDPPAFGNGPHGEKWQFERDFKGLLEIAVSLLSKQALLLMVNTYSDAGTLQFLEKSFAAATQGLQGGNVKAGTLALTTRTGRMVPTGNFAYWQFSDIV